MAEVCPSRRAQAVVGTGGRLAALPPAFSPLAEPNQKQAGKGLWKISFSGSQPPQEKQMAKQGCGVGMESSS